jgi:hypothetical protein
MKSGKASNGYSTLEIIYRKLNLISPNTINKAIIDLDTMDKISVLYLFAELLKG